MPKQNISASCASAERQRFDSETTATKFQPIYSAKVGRNKDLFPDVLRLHVPVESAILDMTYGRGNFWSLVDMSTYRLTTNDLKEPADVQADLRSMPFADGSFDAVVLDLPYMDRDKPYHNANYGVGTSHELRTQSGIRNFYFAGAREAHRLLRRNGVLILKCQDSGKNWNHAVFMELPGFECEDLFVLLQSDTPSWDPKWKRQHHARKRHSYFIVLRKRSQVRRVSIA